MAERMDYIDELIEFNERPHPRQRVLRDRLHPFDKYDAEDIQHNSDLNGALPPTAELHQCIPMFINDTGYTSDAQPQNRAGSNLRICVGAFMCVSVKKKICGVARP